MRHRTESQQHLLEREIELAELRAVIDCTQAGDGGLVVIEGSAGAGKSAQLAAACDYADTKGMRVLSARGSELEREFAFGAIRQLLERPLAATTPA